MNRLILLVFILLGVLGGRPAYAHFFGASMDIGGYQVSFLPFPPAPVVGTNSTLNFSVLKDNSNIYNIFAAITITEKASGAIVFQKPYRIYETSDISVPYIFENVGNYVVTLQTRITGDEKYQAQPLVASFDISAGTPGIPFDELMIYYVVPGAAAMAGIAIYLRSKSKI